MRLLNHLWPFKVDRTKNQPCLCPWVGLVQGFLPLGMGQRPGPDPFPPAGAPEPHVVFTTDSETSV